MELGLTELEQFPELIALTATTVPFLRPTFWPYVLGEAPDATSIEDYLARYQVGGLEGGQPSGVDRLYAGLRSHEPNRGISGRMNQFRPEVASESFSLIEFAVFCPAEGPTQEMIGVVISIDKANVFGTDRRKLPDDDPRLHIEYARSVNGQVQYNWDGMDGEFVANPSRLHHPGQKVPVSVLGGTQVEHLTWISRIQAGLSRRVSHCEHNVGEITRARRGDRICETRPPFPHRGFHWLGVNSARDIASHGQEVAGFGVFRSGRAVPG